MVAMKKILSTLILSSAVGLSYANAAIYELRLPLGSMSVDSSPVSSVWTPSTSNPTTMVASDGTLTLGNTPSNIKGVSISGDMAGFIAAQTLGSGYGHMYTVINNGTTTVPMGAILSNPNANGAAVNYTQLELVKINGEGQSFSDCSDNSQVNIHFDGDYPVPDGWADASSPPIDSTWESGYWSLITSVSQSYIDVAPSQGSGTPRVISAAYTYLNSLPLTLNAFTTTYPLNDVNYQIDVGYEYGTFDRFYAQKIGCDSSSVYEPADICGLTEAPLLTGWPSDGRQALALIDNQFSTHALDGDAPTQGSITSLSFLSDSGTGSLTALTDSTWKWQTNLTSTCGGSQSAPVIKYGSSNQKEIIF